MARQPGVVYLLILLPGMIVHLCWCARHVNYKEFDLENEKICHYLNKKFTLDIRNTTAVIVKPNHFFDRWNVIKNVQCRFVFKTARGEGLFAVIHKMFFRFNGSECLDYVRFKRSDGHQTIKFCGEVAYAMPTYPPSSIEDIYDYTYTEYDPIKHLTGAELETEIFISMEKLISGQSLHLSIVYTPYKDCNKVDPEQFKPVGRNSCIRNEYICDGIRNCPPNVCEDEQDCTSYTNIVSRNDTVPEVTVGAVTTVILCSIIFVLCLWICKRSKKLCWSSDCAGPNTCSRPNSPPPDTDSPASCAVPTAPMLEVAVSPVADKDLPPSYDSLFPEQSNPARS